MRVALVLIWLGAHIVALLIAATQLRGLLARRRNAPGRLCCRHCGHQIGPGLSLTRCAECGQSLGRSQSVQRKSPYDVHVLVCVSVLATLPLLVVPMLEVRKLAATIDPLSLRSDAWIARQIVSSTQAASPSVCREAVARVCGARLSQRSTEQISRFLVSSFGTTAWQPQFGDLLAALWRSDALSEEMITRICTQLVSLCASLDGIALVDGVLHVPFDVRATDIGTTLLIHIELNNFSLALDQTRLTSSIGPFVVGFGQGVVAPRSRGEGEGLITQSFVVPFVMGDTGSNHSPNRLAMSVSVVDTLGKRVLWSEVIETGLR